ncbi:MAG TPA: hypothetical protein VFH68_26825 [Polyangia bacterium]|jgi:hypothetical protein|nr:hypothetical protein [Polyangia bacterium]
MAPPAMVVDDRRGRARARGAGVGAFLLALATAGALLHVGVRMKGIEVAYDLGRERKLNTELEEQRRQLHIEIGMLKDPVRVVALARDKLKMGPPLPGDILRGPPPAPPAPAQAPEVPAARAPAPPAHRGSR